MVQILLRGNQSGISRWKGNPNGIVFFLENFLHPSCEIHTLHIAVNINDDYVDDDE